MIDPYQILGVRSNATGPQLKKTLHRLARECHPDSGKADMIRDMVLDYRAHARRRLKEEFPSISAEVQTLRIDALNAVVQ